LIKGQINSLGRKEETVYLKYKENNRVKQIPVTVIKRDYILDEEKS
jgi:hypothetical protein